MLATSAETQDIVKDSLYKLFPYIYVDTHTHIGTLDDLGLFCSRIVTLFHHHSYKQNQHTAVIIFHYVFVKNDI